MKRADLDIEVLRQQLDSGQIGQDEFDRIISLRGQWAIEERVRQETLADSLNAAKGEPPPPPPGTGRRRSRD